MFESLKRIIPAVLAGLLAVSAPLAAHAQLDAAALLRAQQRGENTNLYGTNPFETQDEEGELQDTTKRSAASANRSNPIFSTIPSGRFPISSTTWTASTTV